MANISIVCKKSEIALECEQYSGENKIEWLIIPIKD